MPSEVSAPDGGLASVRPLERACPVTNSADTRVWDGVRGDSPIPVEVASTPRMRRFTDIWITERKRQLASEGAA